MFSRILTKRTCGKCLWCREETANFNLKQRSRVSANKMFSHSYSWRQPTGPYTGLEVFSPPLNQKVNVSFSNENHSSWYASAPQSYDCPNLSYAVSFVHQDIIQRILKNRFRINIITALKIHDINDRVMKRSLESGCYWKELSWQQEKKFFQDMAKLNVLEPNLRLYPSINMGYIIKYIASLLEKKLAYVTKDGSVFFEVSKYPRFGELQGFDKDKATNKTIDYKKDFVLWQAKKSYDDPSWVAPWGEGRPTTYVESSALSSIIFGPKIDIYADSFDLSYPFHEYEDTLKSVTHQTQQGVNYYLHFEGLDLEASNSPKTTVEEMLRNYDSDTFRMACLLQHYRNKFVYNETTMEEAVELLRTFKIFQKTCWSYINGFRAPVNIDKSIMMENLKHAVQEVDAGFNDDFNTPYILKVLMDQVSSVTRCVNNASTESLPLSPCLDTVSAVYNFVLTILNICGFKNFQPIEVHEQIYDKMSCAGTLSSEIVGDGSNFRENVLKLRNCSSIFKTSDGFEKLLKQKIGATKEEINNNVENKISSRAPLEKVN